MYLYYNLAFFFKNTHKLKVIVFSAETKEGDNDVILSGLGTDLTANKDSKSLLSLICKYLIILNCFNQFPIKP